MNHQNDFEAGDYNALDLRISTRYADDYLHAQRGREGFDAERGVDALLMGSAYLPAVSDERHRIKDIDLYVPDREVFESLENIPNIGYSDNSEDVMHMEPQAGWHGELYIEFFNSIEGALDREDGAAVDRALQFELEQPHDTFYDGEVLHVGVPSPGAFAVSKDLSDNREKYREQIREVDRVFGTGLEEELF